MQGSFSHNLLCATAAVALLAACAGSGNGGVPNAASLATAQKRLGPEAVSIALSGEYIGRFHGNGKNNNRAKLVLSQFQSALGGAIVSGGKSEGLAGVIAWVVNGHTISGNASTGYCTFSMSGTYKYRRLSGTYTTMAGCSGQTGTFTFWHKCYFQGTGSEIIHSEGGVKPC